MNTKLTTGLLLAMAAFAANADGYSNRTAQGQPVFSTVKTGADVAVIGGQSQAPSGSGRPEYQWPDQPSDGLDDGYTNVDLFKHGEQVDHGGEGYGP